jgi:hypothetical protein
MNRFATILFVLVLLVPTSVLADHASRAWDGAGISAAAGTPFPPTLDDIQANVFTPSCALSFCHGEGLAGNLDLRPGASYSQLVNVPSAEVPSALRVEPYNAEDSYLICKLEACQWMVGQQMPLIGDLLDQAVIDVIREWIDKGAPETPISVDEHSWGQVKALYR